MSKDKDEVTVNRLAAQVAWNQPPTWGYEENEDPQDHNKRSIRYIAAGEFLSNWGKGKVPVGWKRPRQIEDLTSDYPPELIERVKVKIEKNKQEAIEAENRRIAEITAEKKKMEERRKREEELKKKEEEEKPADWATGGAKLKSRKEVEEEMKKQEEQAKRDAAPWLAANYLKDETKEDKKDENEVKPEWIVAMEKKKQAQEEAAAKVEEPGKDANDGKPEWMVAMEKKKQAQEEAARKEKEREKELEKENEAEGPAWASVLKKKDSSVQQPKPTAPLPVKEEPVKDVPVWANALKKKDDTIVPERVTTAPVEAIQETPKDEYKLKDEKSNTPAWANMLKKKEETQASPTPAPPTPEILPKETHEEKAADVPAWVNVLKKKEPVTVGSPAPAPHAPEILPKETSDKKPSDVPVWANALKKKEPVIIPAKVEEDDAPKSNPWRSSLKSAQVDDSGKKDIAPPTPEFVRNKSSAATSAPSDVPAFLKTFKREESEGFKLPERMQDRESMTRTSSVSSTPKMQKSTSLKAASSSSPYSDVSKKEDAEDRLSRSSSKKHRGDTSSRSSSLKRDNIELKSTVEQLSRKVDNLEAMLQRVMEQMEELLGKK